MDADQFIERARMMSIFGDSMSTDHVHNHLIGAYHEANMYVFAPPWPMMWKFSSTIVPRAVQQALRPDELVAELREKITRARGIIDRIRPDLDHEVTHLVTISPDPSREDPDLHPFVTATHRFTPSYSPAWAFQFNPYRLAVALLDEYEAFIIKTMRGGASSFTKLSRIHRKVKAMEVNVRLVQDNML